MPPKETSPLFSIVIPTLGKTDIWLEAIHSVQTQTFNSWEVIAIDSGPEEKSRPLIEALGDSRIIYVNTSRENPHLNWDTGYRRSSGRYIMWVDDDNYLLPHALSTLAELTTRTQKVDFVTANHMHWNDLHHPIDALRNHLAIPPRLYSGERIEIQSESIVRKLLGVPYEGAPIYARFHTSAQAVRRDIVEALLAHIGKIDFGSTSTHSLRIGSLALSKSIWFADVPIALIAQSGLSMSIVWPNESSSIRHASYTYNLSEVHANTYINYVHENHLLLQKTFPAELARYRLPQARFLAAHSWSLIFLKLSWSDFWRYWREVERVVAASSEPAVRALRPTVLRYKATAVVIKLLRASGLYPLAQKMFKSTREGGKGHILIPLQPYGTKSMQNVAEQLPRIIEEKFKTPYAQFAKTNEPR